MGEAEGELFLVESPRRAGVRTGHRESRAIVVIHNLVDNLVRLKAVDEVLFLNLALGCIGHKTVGELFAPGDFLRCDIHGLAARGGVVSLFGQRREIVHKLVHVHVAEIGSERVAREAEAVEGIGTACHRLVASEARGEQDVCSAQRLLGAKAEQLVLQLGPA